jgi:hypothetical protein
MSTVINLTSSSQKVPRNTLIIDVSHTSEIYMNEIFESAQRCLIILVNTDIGSHTFKLKSTTSVAWKDEKNHSESNNTEYPISLSSGNMMVFTVVKTSSTQYSVFLL